MLDKKWLDFLHDAYDQMTLGLSEVGKELPANSAFGENDFDFKKRELDCAVIRFAVELAETKMAIKFDSVRAAFGKAKNFIPMPTLKRTTLFNYRSSIPIALREYFFLGKKRIVSFYSTIAE